MRQPDAWTNPPPGFDFVLFDRTDHAANADRYYLIGWLPTLFASGLVVMCWGRKGSSQRTRVLEYASLDAAWLVIRAAIRTRLRHGYRVVGEWMMLSFPGADNISTPCPCPGPASSLSAR
jgi:predicted DNA-binding WGR domain protein